MLYIVPPSSRQPIFWVRTILCLPSPHSIQAQQIELEHRSILLYSNRSMDVLLLIPSIILCQTQKSTMSGALLCQDFAETGENVCFSIFHRTLVEQSIEEGHRVAISLRGNSRSNNLIRKELCHHSVHLTLGCLGVGIRRKVNDCVLNGSRLQYPSSDGDYMGHWKSFTAVAVRPRIVDQPHMAAHPHVAAQRHVQDVEGGEDEHSDDSSETRLQPDDDIFVT
jgi:hypothetical protein